MCGYVVKPKTVFRKMYPTIVIASVAHSAAPKNFLRFIPRLLNNDLGRSVIRAIRISGISAGNIFRLSIISPSKSAMTLRCPPHAKHSQPVNFLVRQGSEKRFFIVM